MDKTVSEATLEALAHIEKAKTIFASGPLEYYLKKLAYHSEALLTEFAPLKAGGRAIVVKQIECKNGWEGSDKTLAIGAVGDITEVDYDDGRFVVDFVPDNQWWKDSKGVYQVKDRLHSYYLRADKLAAIAKAEVSDGN